MTKYRGGETGSYTHTHTSALAKSWTNALRSLCGQRHDYPFSCVISVIKVKSSDMPDGESIPLYVLMLKCHRRTKANK